MESALRLGDTCVLADGFSVKSIGPHQQFTFSGAVKSSNQAWCAVVLAYIEAQPSIVVLPFGAVHSVPGEPLFSPLDHMAALQQVRSHTRLQRSPARALRVVRHSSTPHAST